jgi:CRP/FNR family transcriptional regulator
VVFYEGNRAEGLYLIKKGKIKLYQTGDGGKEQILKLVKQGDMIGYRSVISGDLNTETASVMEDATLCFIPKSTFFNFLHNNPEFSTSMMRVLSNDLKDAEARVVALAQKPVRERIAETILMLKDFYGEDENGSIDFGVSREEIANMVGTATETTIRMLSDFKSEHLIELANKKIKILNHQGLVKAAHF